MNEKTNDTPKLGTTSLDAWRNWRAFVANPDQMVVGRTPIGVEVAWGFDDRPPGKRTPTGLRLERLSGCTAQPLTDNEEDQILELLKQGRLTIGIRRRGWRTDPSDPKFDVVQVLHQADGVRLESD